VLTCVPKLAAAVGTVIESEPPVSVSDIGVSPGAASAGTADAKVIVMIAAAVNKVLFLMKRPLMRGQAEG